MPTNNNVTYTIPIVTNPIEPIENLQEFNQTNITNIGYPFRYDQLPWQNWSAYNYDFFDRDQLYLKIGLALGSSMGLLYAILNLDNQMIMNQFVEEFAVFFRQEGGPFLQQARALGNNLALPLQYTYHSYYKEVNSVDEPVPVEVMFAFDNSILVPGFDDVIDDRDFLEHLIGNGFDINDIQDEDLWLQYQMMNIDVIGVMHALCIDNHEDF